MTFSKRNISKYIPLFSTLFCEKFLFMWNCKGPKFWLSTLKILVTVDDKDAALEHIFNTLFRKCIRVLGCQLSENPRFPLS